jgi:hypothetical protein
MVTATQRVTEIEASLALAHQLAVDIKTRSNVAMRDVLAPAIAAVHDLIAATPEQRRTDCGALYQMLITTVGALTGVPQVRGVFYALEARRLVRKAWSGRGDEPRKILDRRGSTLQRRILDFVEDEALTEEVVDDVLKGPHKGQYAGARYRSLVALKVKARSGACLGVLIVDALEPDSFVEGQVAALYPLAELLGLVEAIMEKAGSSQ